MFKFIVLLVASAAAVKIEQKQPGGGEGPSCHDIAGMIYEKCNQGEDDGAISWKEAKACGAPKSFKDEFHEVAGEDKKVDYKEFMAECQAHFNE